MNEISPNIIYDAITNDAFKYYFSNFLDVAANTASSVKGMDLLIRIKQYWERSFDRDLCGDFRSESSEIHDLSFGGFNIATIRRKPLVIVQSIITASR